MGKIKLILTFIILGLVNVVQAQLADSWFGHYKGDLEIINVKGEKTVVAMELKIENRTDSLYAFTIVYGEDSMRQVRDYALIPKSINQYLLDEKNGIELPMTLFDNRLISVFEVQGNLLQVSYSLVGDNIIFRTTSARKSKVSGGTDEIPEVQGYITTVDQSAVLGRL
ncbi:MAG: hypothetical protein R3277_11155 [Brumimicrobium sp.]|nr:hypothetical protein [Brumimicrobium sp.]